jgi:hypothetical protein
MPNLSKESIKKMRKVIRAVLAEPAFYDQDRAPADVREPACGTTCCAAGWVEWLFAPERLQKIKGGFAYSKDCLEQAPFILGIRSDMRYHGDPTDNLFDYARHWPEPYARNYGEAATKQERAKVFRDRWEKFIETDGVV